MTSMHRPTRTLLAAAFALTLLLGACGSDDGDDSAPPSSSGFDGTPDIALDDSASDDSTPDDSTPDDSTSDDKEAPTHTTVPQRVTINRDQDLRVTDARALVTCDGGGEIEIAAGVEDVEILGPCEEVDVDASGAAVKVETTDSLNVDGNDNQVQAGTVGELDIDGSGNSVLIYTASDIDIEGSDNTVTWTSGSPEIDDEGSGNTVSQG